MIRQTLREMYTDRGWVLQETEGPTEGSAEGPTEGPAKAYDLLATTDTGKQAVALVLDQSADIKKPHIQQLIWDDTVECITFVFMVKPISNIKKLETQSQHKIEIFYCNELTYNISHHDLQPRFSKLVGDELADFKRLRLKVGFLLYTDPICRYYRYLPGDIIKIMPRTDTDPIQEMLVRYVK